MLVNFDFKELLSILNDKGVKYLVIGGYAFIKYAEPHYTKDLELWVLADSQNANAVFTALRAFGAPLTNLTPDDFAAEGYFYQMGVPPVRVDILMSIPGLSFEEAWGKARRSRFRWCATSFYIEAGFDYFQARFWASTRYSGC